jgi:hypothetical protein
MFRATSSDLPAPGNWSRVFAFMEDEMAQTYGQYGGLNAMNQLQGAGQQTAGQQFTGAEVAAQPRTIASAVGKLDQVNERLAAIHSQLEHFADQIGGPRPTPGGQIVGNSTAVPPPQSAVHRLNDAAESAHMRISDIEQLLNSIGRALG